MKTVLKTVFSFLVLLFASASLFAHSPSKDDTFITLTPANFKKQLNASEFVVVKVFSPHCGCCQALYPVLKKLANKFPKVTFAKINVTLEPELSRQYKITSFPTLLFFKNGELVTRLNAGLTEKFIESKIRGLLGN